MHKRSRVEPQVVDAAPARARHVISGSDPVRPAGLAETQVDGRVLNCEGRPGVEHTRARELPFSQDSVNGSGAAQILPVAADRNRISEGSRDDVAAVEIGPGALQLEISRVERAAESAGCRACKLRGIVNGLAVAVTDAVEEAPAGAFAQCDLTGSIDRIGGEVPVIDRAGAELRDRCGEIGPECEEVLDGPVRRIVVVLPAKAGSLRSHV